MRSAVAAGALLLGIQASALACGVCVEDKVAAVYDHGIVVRALERRHGVAFLAIDGVLPARADLRRSIEAAIERTAGVDRGTARVSLESASLSFAYDPRRPGLGRVLGGIGKALAEKGLQLSILRVIDDASPGKAGTQGGSRSVSSRPRGRARRAGSGRTPCRSRGREAGPAG